MGLRINSNLEALNAHRHLLATSDKLAKSMERLSSGLRINRAADDAAGLAISEKITAQVNGLNQASRNAQDAISMVQTAEGALQETHSILQRMRELAVQAANDTLTPDDRQAIQSEINQLIEEVGRIASSTEFNTQKLLEVASTSTADVSFTYHVGANANQTISLSISAANTLALGVSSASIDVTGATSAELAIGYLDDAIKNVSSSRANLGAMQNRLEHTVANLGVASENLQAANSRIRDVDMAAEMMSYTKLQILQQAGTAMLAQANLAPQAVLKLLG